MGSESSSTAAEASGLEVLQAAARQVGPAAAEAVSRVLERLPADLRQIPAEHVIQHMLWVARACVAPTSLTEDELGATAVLRRRLIELLRSELITQWSEDAPAAAPMLQTLQRLERAQCACEPTLDQAFAAELTDRGGFDLVVEVAHDMRSPLTSILFLSEILHRGQSGPLNDVQKRQIGIVYGAALGLVGMASDMIEMARGGNRLASDQAVAFSVNDLLRSVGDLVRPTAEEKGLDLRVNELSSDRRVGHPIPLSRVMLNLTTNAMKFTNEGRVEVSAEPGPGKRVTFAVRDTGPGIPADAMDYLYQPFRREPRRERGYHFSGTGLGLAICRRLVTAMGSELVVKTQLGWGTEFSFQLVLPPAELL